MNALRVVLWLTMGVAVSAAAGCGSPAPAFVPVKGRVYYRGVPLAGGTIVFAPDAERGNNGELAYAVIAPDGSFALATGDHAGAAPGWHRISVAPDPNAPRPAARSSYDYGLPLRYRNPALSGLACEVKAGENAFEFQLDDS